MHLLLVAMPLLLRASVTGLIKDSTWKSDYPPLPFRRERERERGREIFFFFPGKYSKQGSKRNFSVGWAPELVYEFDLFFTLVVSLIAIAVACLLVGVAYCCWVLNRGDKETEKPELAPTTSIEKIESKGADSRAERDHPLVTGSSTTSSTCTRSSSLAPLLGGAGSRASERMHTHGRMVPREGQAGELAGMECLATRQEEGEEGRQGKKLRARVSCLRISAVYYVLLLGIHWWEDGPVEARQFGLPAVQGHRTRGAIEGTSGRWPFGQSQNRAEDPQHEEEIASQVGEAENQGGREEGSLGSVSSEVQGASRQARRDLQDGHQNLRTGHCRDSGRSEQNDGERSRGHGHFDKRGQIQLNRTEAPACRITSPYPVSSAEDGSLCCGSWTDNGRFSVQRQVPTDEQAASFGFDIGGRRVRQVCRRQVGQIPGHREGSQEGRGGRDPFEITIQGEESAERHVEFSGKDGVIASGIDGCAYYESRCDGRAAHELFQNRNQEGEGGAVFQEATPSFFASDGILECLWLWWYTVPCLLLACSPLMPAPSSAPANIRGLIESLCPEAQSHSWGMTDFSNGFGNMSFDPRSNEIVLDFVNFVVLGVCLGLTIQVWTTLILRTSLKGFCRRLHLSWWSIRLMVLWGLHVFVTLRLIHFEGVHIRLEVAREAFWLPICLFAAVTAGRLSVRLRIDRIGKCKGAKGSRKPVSRCSKPGTRWKYLFMCFSLAFSHATATAQKLSYDLADPGPDNPFLDVTGFDPDLGWTKQDGGLSEAASFVQYESSLLFNQAGGEQQSDRSEVGQADVPYGTMQDPSQVVSQAFGCDGNGCALPEAEQPLIYGGSSPSRPCEESSQNMSLTRYTEGLSQIVAPLSVNGLVEDFNDMELSDDRQTVLGNFVFRSQTQVRSDSEKGLKLSVLEDRIQSFVFMSEPRNVKVWFAPNSACCGEARDALMPAESFGNLQDFLCGIWSDRVRLSACSFELVRPQPTEHFQVEIIHFLCVTPSTANIGKTGTEWRTSHLKAYPSAFCRFLALLFKKWWCDRAEAPFTEVDEAREWLKELYSHVLTGQRTFGPDFHRGAHH